MAKVEWKQVLGWGEEEISDLRFVGYSYIKQGHYKTALKFFEALTVLEPESAYDMQTLGAIYLQLGDNLAALTTLEKALRLEAHHPATLLNRAKALLLLGYNKQGIMQAKALEGHPNLAIANQAEALLLAYT
ncbi:MAG: tetratricopeptide repeat protein [Chlamydiae bacterium]|nr:tetratricopeptide repeat protein [Chlamydiota bacterium]